jgi:hypothetical protein
MWNVRRGRGKETTDNHQAARKAQNKNDGGVFDVIER